MRDLGLAKTTDFMLGTAEVRLGAVGDLFKLSEDDSIGLVKNVTMTGEMEQTKLGQGLRNKTVFAVTTSETLNISAEVYEYTAKNIAYALGLNTGVVATPVTTTASAAVTGDDVVVDLGVADESGFAVDDYILVKTNKGLMANEVVGTAAGNLTLRYAIPTGVEIASNAEVSRSSTLDLGNTEDIYYSCAIVGVLADGGEVSFLFPKVKIIRGFNIQFGTSDYGNMPFEIEPYSLVTSDVDYPRFGQAQGKLLI